VLWVRVGRDEETDWLFPRVEEPVPKLRVAVWEEPLRTVLRFVCDVVPLWRELLVRLLPVRVDVTVPRPLLPVVLLFPREELKPELWLGLATVVTRSVRPVLVVFSLRLF